MPDVTALMVPIHIDALVLAADAAVAGPVADFTRLPYFDGARDVNSGTGYLSEAVVADPFAGQSLRLPPGVHLHWALPDALTRARGGAFPAVPDRWLVVRSRGGAVERSWVVESDYLHPPGEGAETGSVAFPIAGAGPPFRRLGRTVPFARWRPEPDGDRLADLTAAGWGEPLFAAFYPHCRNVFGLHDPDPVAPGIRYDVLGWYTDPRRDPGPDETSWAVPAGSATPDRVVCFGRIAISRDGVSRAPAAADVTVAVGNTGAQALGAHLARLIAPRDPGTVEDQLAAVLLGTRLDPADPDVAGDLRQAVHEDGFVPVPAGTVWTLRRDTPAEATTRAAVPAEPLDALGHALNALNGAQQAYDRAVEEIESQAGQLFADWYRYMLCAYPPAGSGEDYPGIDEVRAFVTGHTLSDVARRVAETGELAGEAAAPGTLAGAVRAAAARVGAALADVNRDLPADAGFRLQSIEAPRYWAPAEPVVLLAGDALAPSVRHGTGERLDCAVVSGLPLPPTGAGDVLTLIQATGARETAVGHREWDDGDWNPLTLSWQADVTPVADPHAHPGQTRGYAPDYLLATHGLAEDEPELRLHAGTVRLRAAPAGYHGRSILTPYAADLHRRRLAGYVLGSAAGSRAGPPRTRTRSARSSATRRRGPR